ncbi:MAG: ribosomal protein S18-alanine N-acetyltransferase [Clostridium celatum]|uniref:ribosomal protein S18-alanine N-acetyltransferase n=1 Tax=uncultured Clostridium sp. TaxID=59620 RepID=UPI0025D6A3A9|nr:ribosomal protein S18-alanine N-acetyltransferase [uncultured Clostridium sp.]MDU4882781.1 ribosomal protein S18-alanine N-acetyltransferase [Clostridium celatum]MDU5263191.1 ribosomal protein S18-alanine N-acetyltransferase [Clostridium celatum]MDU7075949.1 ribosomal protein S18-alanine N-acetyltransferase [Clostridium celatum]
MKIDYSLMNETHINGVYELSKECFATPWSLDSINNELNNTLAKYVIAQDLSTGEVVGFVGVWIIAGEGDITNIAVNPKYRKLGIASKLLINLFEVCKTFNCEDITLEVRASNIPAQNLYKKFDFKEEGLRKGYYQDNNEDAIIMWKRG